MATLLKRLSMNLERRMGLNDDVETPSSRAMASSTSFNDFSMHISQEVDDDKDHSDMYTRPEHAKPSSPNRGGAGDERPSPFMSGGGPGGTAGGGASPVVTKALTIPRTSVAHILMRESSLSTPRSQLDMPSAASLPTPSHSLTAADEPGSPKSPRSPKSPTTPGGRRRRQQKIHGMDYYEFCELVRAGSL